MKVEEDGGRRCGSGVCKLRLLALSSTRAAAYPSLIHSLPNTRCCKVLSFHFTHEEARLLKGTVPVKEQDSESQRGPLFGPCL